LSAEQTVDWFRLLWDMVQRGQKLTHIAERTGIAHGALRLYMHGSQPPYWRGVKLVALWSEVTGCPPERVPMAELPLTPRVVPARDAVRAGCELERVWR